MIERSAVQPHNWYFLDCPADELAACCYYEYARYSPAIVEAARTLDDNARDILSIHESVSYVAALVDDFPQTPWLNLDARKRRRLVKRFGKSGERWDLVIERPRKIIGMPLPFPSGGKCLYQSDGQTIAAIHIPWQCSNKEILAAFQRSLDEHRPPGSASPLGRKNSHRDYLNALGAERLLAHCRSVGARSVAGAAMQIITSYTKLPQGKMRAAPYAGHTPLTNAAKKVQKILCTLYHFGNEAAYNPGGQYPLHYWMPEVDTRPDE